MIAGDCLSASKKTLRGSLIGCEGLSSIFNSLVTQHFPPQTPLLLVSVLNLVLTIFIGIQPKIDFTQPF